MSWYVWKQKSASPGVCRRAALRCGRLDGAPAPERWRSGAGAPSRRPHLRAAHPHTPGEALFCFHTYQEMLHTYQEKQQQKQQQKQHEQQQRDSRSSNAKAVAEATHAEPAQAMRYAAM